MHGSCQRPTHAEFYLTARCAEIPSFTIGCRQAGSAEPDPQGDDLSNFSQIILRKTIAGITVSLYVLGYREKEINGDRGSGTGPHHWCSIRHR